MSIQRVTSKSRIRITISAPGDKSISHRAIMFGALASGVTEIEGFLPGEDCLSTIACFRKLGVDIAAAGDRVTVNGKGLWGLTAPGEDALDVGNSGTTMRLITGVLAGQSFDSRLTGDASIKKRPMKRVFDPLRLMGAKFSDHETAPFTICGRPLKGVSYTLIVASAQVKSAIILAALYAKGETIITESQPTRDHTEIMLKYFGADLKKDGRLISVKPVPRLYARKVQIPGDISSAAFFIALGLITPESEITVTGVGINPTRTGIIDAFISMGGRISITNRRTIDGEETADITARSSNLKGTDIYGAMIPRMIDEIPILAAAAAFAEGRTVIRDAEELKYKESNRIRAMAMELSKLGGQVSETPDGMIIEGGRPLFGTIVDSHGDHRIAMSLAIAACAISGDTFIKNSECVNISFSNFFELLKV
ncbi:MAG: 3-phosphoshikimate 1-carboxyvinyltransferase [Clostridiales bacterium]|jgi:3-phosphoshikimate 1-carboxyvinyltransferase|nr:3-phosphoshikimate 1-carboxyvinyltransferase [Clostridiales bacterium]